jgi:hypothetical protein
MAEWIPPGGALRPGPANRLSRGIGWSGVSSPGPTNNTPCRPRPLRQGVHAPGQRCSALQNRGKTRRIATFTPAVNPCGGVNACPAGWMALPGALKTNSRFTRRTRRGTTEGAEECGSPAASPRFGRRRSVQRSAPRTSPSRVRDSRPQGREPGSRGERARLERLGHGANRGLGAVGNSCIVAYGARSPTRSAAEGHAQAAVGVGTARGTLAPTRKGGPRRPPFRPSTRRRDQPRTLATISSDLALGTSSYCANCIEYTARPCDMERRLVE